jgi:hypothetical protein
LAIAGMRRCSTVWCCARAATRPSILVAAMRAPISGQRRPSRRWLFEEQGAACEAYVKHAPIIHLRFDEDHQ